MHFSVHYQVFECLYWRIQLLFHIIWLLSDNASSERLSKYDNSIFSFWYSWSVARFWEINFLYLHCSGSACSDCTEGSGSSTLVIFANFLVLQFPFSQVQILISFNFFPEIGNILFHFHCRNPYLVGLPSTKCLQTYRNGPLQSHISDHLGQRYKVFSAYTHLFNFLEPFHILCINHHNFIRTFYK